MSEYHDMPCGRCPCGTYALGAVEAGVEVFRGVETRKAALAAAPRCTTDDSHICYGTRDFIVAVQWPMDDARRAAILAEARS